jgi:hypothetical protein
MSDLSPQMGPKRTLITLLSPIAIYELNLKNKLGEPPARAIETGMGGRIRFCRFHANSPYAASTPKGLMI